MLRKTEPHGALALLRRENLKQRIQARGVGFQAYGVNIDGNHRNPLFETQTATDESLCYEARSISSSSRAASSSDMDSIFATHRFSTFSASLAKVWASKR